MKTKLLIIFSFIISNIYAQETTNGSVKTYYTTLYDKGVKFYEGNVLEQDEEVRSGNSTVKVKKIYKHGQGTSFLTNTPNAYKKGNFYYDELNGHGEMHVGAIHYVGNWKDNKKNGKGKEWSDGSDGMEKWIYEGEFVNDMYEGKGKFVRGSYSLEGDFSKNQPFGQVKETIPDGENWVTYSGMHSNKSRNGYGEMIYSNGDIYRGPWLNNKRHGEGTYIFTNSGTTYTTRMVFENDIKNIEKTLLLTKDQQANNQSSGVSSNQTSSTPKQNSTVSNSSIDFVRVGKIDIMTKDLGEFNYSQAKNAIQALGEGWRLPTESELLIMFNNQDKIGQLRKKPMYRNQNQIFWGNYLGGSFSNYYVIMNNSLNPGLTYSTYWSENRDRLENEFFLVRAVRDVPSIDLSIANEEKKANDDAYTKLVEIIFRAMLTEALSGSSGSSNQSSSFTDRTPSQSGSTSSGLEVCAYCKPYDAKGHYINDYDPIRKIYVNGRYVLRPGHKPCTTCHGTGNCLSYSSCNSSQDFDWRMYKTGDLTCQICRGDRFEVCDRCKGSGYRNK